MNFDSYFEYDEQMDELIEKQLALYQQESPYNRARIKAKIMHRYEYCIKYGICPVCGGELEKEEAGYNKMALTEPAVILYCSHCRHKKTIEE